MPKKHKFSEKSVKITAALTPQIPPAAEGFTPRMIRLCCTELSIPVSPLP